MEDLIEKAKRLATEAHAGQKRKYNGEPYINHLERVAGHMERYEMPDYAVAAAWLYDIVEDTDVTLEDLEPFGAGIVDIVRELTNATVGNRKQRMAKNLERLRNASYPAQTIKCADILDNCTGLAERDPSFAPIYLNEKAAQLGVMRHAYFWAWAEAINVIWQEIEAVAA